MIFPVPAVLVVAWFLLTPILRFLLWIGGSRFGRITRLVAAHVGALIIMLIVTALALDAAELAGMAVLFAIGQSVFFVNDFIRPHGPPP
jgi:hypothetical protein